MFVLKRNQIIITALVVMVAVAGYLNYIDGRGDSISPIVLNDEGEIAALIPSEIITVNSDMNEDIGVALTLDENPEIATETQADIIVNETGEAIETGENQSDTGTAVFVNKTADTSYFVEAKLAREQSRSSQKEILTGMINNTNIDQAQRAECASAMLEIQKRIEKETAAEAMIESKGFSEVYVRIDDETVDVVVNKEVLSDAEIAQIEDIVKRKTGMTADKIRISPMKK